MAVKIRLARRGRKKLAMYDVVVADARAPRDGRFIEKVGTYNPNTNPATIVLNEERALKWLLNGAQPTDTVRAMLSYKGILYKKHLQIGVLKGALTQEKADELYEAWKQAKEQKIAGKVDALSRKKAETAKARLEAEAKVRAAKEQALAEKNAAALAAEAESANSEDAAVAESTEGESTENATE